MKMVLFKVLLLAVSYICKLVASEFKLERFGSASR